MKLFKHVDFLRAWAHFHIDSNICIVRHKLSLILIRKKNQAQFAMMCLLHTFSQHATDSVAKADHMATPANNGSTIRVEDVDALLSALTLTLVNGDSSSPEANTVASTGLVYDDRCLLHQNVSTHLERPERMSTAFQLLEQSDLLQRVVRIPAREATYAELLRLGGREACSQLNKYERMTERLQKCKDPHQCEHIDGDTFFNKDSLLAAKLSVGGLIDLMEQIMSGELRNGYAIVRPPGHHADNRSASGFCLFNNVGVAVQALRANHPHAKVAIVDFDVHSGNGSQHMFYTDPNVLFFSIHRSDNGNYYPGTGDHTECGKGAGIGFTVNVPLNVTEMGDTEYLEAFRTILMPVLGEFQPDIIAVSAGYDAAHNDPIGSNMHVSTAGFAHMTALLKNFVDQTHGRIVLALEGGYNVHAVAQAIQASIRVLLGEEPPALPPINWFLDEEFSSLTKNMRETGLVMKRMTFARDLANVLVVQRRYWSCLSPSETPSKTSSVTTTKSKIPKGISS